MLSSILNKLQLMQRNDKSIIESNMQNNNPENADEVLSCIMLNVDYINDMMNNNSICAFLNDTLHFKQSQVLGLLTSFNKFKSNGYNPRSINDLFMTILNSAFITEILEPIVRQYFLNTPSKEEIRIMIVFLSNCIELLPCQFLEKMAMLYPGVQVAGYQFEDKEIETLLSNLKHLISIAKQKIERKRSPSRNKSNLVNYEINDFRNFTVFPQSSDIFCLNEDVKLRRNKFAGADKNKDYKYLCVDDYLDTQFCLLKEDFVRPLRDGIAAIRANLFSKSKLEMKKLQVRIYENTVIGDMFTSMNGLVYNVQFDVKKFKHIDWKKGRRFIFGSLLCFTNNLFEKIYFASVVDCDPKNLEKGNLVVQFQHDPVIEVLDNNTFLMIETKDLFEAYKHVLIKLQTFTTEKFPFKEYLVFGENVRKSPTFMNKVDLKLIDDEAYSDDDFDKSQREAFANALKSDLSLIQGPPGTGKTYVGLKMIKYLVNNFQILARNIGPILVVCYTNHALDQFLTDIIDAIGVQNVLRVGGRSKIEIMKECNMNTIKWNWIRRKAFSPSLFKRGFQNRKDMEVATEKLVQKYARIKNYDNEILSFDDLNCCMSHRDFNFFQRIDFDEWIKGGDSEVKITGKRNIILKQTIIQEQCEICIEEIIYELLGKVLEENDVFENEEEDILLEDPDEILFNHVFLAEDDNLLKYGNKFKYLYKKEENNKEELLGEDDFKYVANKKLIKNKIKNTKPLTEKEYNSLIDLNVDFDVRLKLYRYWLEKYRIILYQQYNDERQNFDILNNDKEEIMFQEYIAIMQSVKVIGMTTTGAARYGSVLDRVGCRVVVIEEAAEVLESHVVCSLSEQCQQLIMIGDHKQLRPKVNVFDLERNYDFGISLFERLIANDCQYFTLQFQHRMRPEISKCVKLIYPELKDSENVFTYNSIAGMKTDIYFFNHNEYEKESIEMSFKNDFEADFVVRLCEYLIKCGNLPKHITVLTLYTGQLYNISNRIRKPNLKGIRVCVVDNFQGEENEIIILSLVRSNDIGKVGFVNSPNRLCVAISRAKRGFYAIGNFKLLCIKISLLADIISKNLSEIEFGNKLPLECLMHPNEHKYYVTKLNDFLRIGCPSRCALKLSCGHLCSQFCHINEPSHNTYNCKNNCEKYCDRKLHKCQLFCHQTCKCEEYVTITLPCNHDKEILCFQKNIRCTELCEKKLGCDHTCLRMCHEVCKCEMIITKTLDCGHDLNMLCGTDMSKIKCLFNCNKLLNCEHTCKEKCWQKCKCKEIINYTLSCSHKQLLPCGSDLLKIQCKTNVEKEFPCGHIITYKCYEKLKKCSKDINKEFNCGHNVIMKCGDLAEDLKCTYKCDIKLKCLHNCQGKCGDCFQGQLHFECKDMCKKQLKCGHHCEDSCHSGYCPPCKKACNKYCQHGQCNLRCGDICDCTLCEVNCGKNIKCVQCKKMSKCSQFCGEICSTLCKDCFCRKYTEDQTYYINKQCNCYILKNEYYPEIKHLGHELVLYCQLCHKRLCTPYLGIDLIFYNKEYSTLFQNLDIENIIKWTDLLKELKEINYLSIKYEDFIRNIETIKICKEDLKIFEISYKFYLQFLNICKLMCKVDADNNIKNYQEDLQKSLFFIVKWLNPFVRNFNSHEITFLNFEKSKIEISSDLLAYLNVISVTDYALAHKEVFYILNEIKKALTIADLEKWLKNIQEIKNNLKNTKQSTEAEEELVERIINTNNIYKEFGLDKLSIEDKLKEIKKLIVRCHPDKNKSLNANVAVRKLLEKKKLLE